MDRKARNSVLFGPSIHGGTGSGRPNGIISPAGHTYRHLSRVELEYQPLPGLVCRAPFQHLSSVVAATNVWPGEAGHAYDPGGLAGSAAMR
jgi:hypothetical protein